MASNIYTQHTADGRHHLARRAVKQGRPARSGVGKRSVGVSMTEREQDRIAEKARELDMSFSQYVVLACTLFDANIFVKEIG